MIDNFSAESSSAYSDIPVGVSFECDDEEIADKDNLSILDSNDVCLLESLLTVHRDINDILSNRGDPSPNTSRIEVLVRVSCGNPKEYLLNEYGNTTGGLIPILAKERYSASTLERMISDDDQRISDAQLFVNSIVDISLRLRTLSVDDLEGRSGVGFLLSCVDVPPRIREDVEKILSENFTTYIGSSDQVRAFDALAQEYDISPIFTRTESGREICKGNVWDNFGCDAYLNNPSTPREYEAKGFVDGYLGMFISRFKMPSIPERILSSWCVYYPLNLVCEFSHNERLHNLRVRTDSVRSYLRGSKKGKKSKMKDEK